MDNEQSPTPKLGPRGQSQNLAELAEWVARSQQAVWDAVQGIPGQPPQNTIPPGPIYIEKAVATAQFYMVETLRLSIERLVVSSNESTRIMSRLTKAYVVLTAAIVALTAVQVWLALG